MIIVPRFNIEPTKDQEYKMFQALGVCRRLYNTVFEQREIHYNQTKNSLTYNKQANELSGLKKAFQNTKPLTDKYCKIA